MAHKSIDDIFHILSRIIIVVPIVVIVGAIYLYYNQTPSFQSFRKKVTPTRPPELKQTNPIGKNSAPNQFNLKGPFVCQFNTKQASISAFVKDRKVSATMVDNTKTTNMVLGEDCIYVWIDTLNSGEKICGLSLYLPWLETIPIADIFGKGMFFMPSVFGNISKTLPADITDINKAMDSCKKTDITNDKIFEIPRNVVFTEKKQ